MDALLLFRINPFGSSVITEAKGLLITNYEKYANTPTKVSSLIVERDFEEEEMRGVEEYLRVSTTLDGTVVDLGEFEGSWEFEEWLCSDLSFSEWKKSREI